MEKQRARFTTVAACVGVMRAVIACIDACTVFTQQLIEARCDTIVVLDREDATTDSRLVGDNDHGNHHWIYSGNCVRGTWQELHLLRLGEIMRILDQSAVAIEKHR